MERLRGLKQLVQDAVDHGSRAVEQIQKETAKRPFDLLEQIPPIKAPVHGIRTIHDTTVTVVHRLIRLSNRIAGEAVDALITRVEQENAASGSPGSAPSEPERAARQPE